MRASGRAALPLLLGTCCFGLTLAATGTEDSAEAGTEDSTGATSVLRCPSTKDGGVGLDFSAYPQETRSNRGGASSVQVKT